jgi:homocitrate synthase
MLGNATRRAVSCRPLVTGAASSSLRALSSFAAKGENYGERPGLDLPDRKGLMDFKIIDSTLREGEQFSTAFFSTEDKIHVATKLSHIGVDYIELVTPMASAQSFKDCETIAKLGLRSKVVTHIRCHMQDAKAAIASGVAGVNMYMATSQALREHSHGKGIEMIIEQATEVINYCKSHNVEVRFSAEDTFRSDMNDLIKVYTAVDKLGVDRIGLADTVGVATPLQVYKTVSTIRALVSCDIEFHAHDDTGCCIANALLAIQAGVTHIDTCVLGIGERNGITPLGGFLARMYTIDKDRIRARYNLPLLRDLEDFVCQKAAIEIPFNNYVTGSSAFSHKAGVHSKAVIANPGSYEVSFDFSTEPRMI